MCPRVTCDVRHTWTEKIAHPANSKIDIFNKHTDKEKR